MLYANYILSEHMLNSNDIVSEVSDAEVVSLLSTSQLGEIDLDAETS